MDPLKAVIAQMKKHTTGQKWVRRGDLEKMREAMYLEEQEIRKRAKVDSSQSSQIGEKPEVNIPVSVSLTREELVARLRSIGEPARLFAETAEDQYERLKAAEKKVAEMGGVGMRPSLLNYQSREKVFWDQFEEEKEGLVNVDRFYNGSELFDDAKEWDDYEDRGEVYRKHKEHPLKLEAASLTYIEKLSFLYRWCGDLLKVWEADLSNLAATDPGALPAQQKKLKETKQALKSLINLFKPQELSEEVLTAFFLVARFCQFRSYIKAHDSYLALASGRIQWKTQKPDPKHRGAILTSTHHTENISEDMYRLFTQSFKRLVSLCQRKMPNVPSKIVIA